MKDEASTFTDELVTISELNAMVDGKKVDEYGKEDVTALKLLVQFSSTELDSIISH